jgi:hypothetical protein
VLQIGKGNSFDLSSIKKDVALEAEWSFWVQVAGFVVIRGSEQH